MMSALLTGVCLLGATFFFLYVLLTRKHKYWEKQNIPYVPPIPLFGNMLDVARFKTSVSEWVIKLYKYGNDKVLGVFLFDEPYLMIRDPEIVKYILEKDFNYFDTRALAAHHDDLHANMIFFSKDTGKWKIMRRKMSPFFTSGNLQRMFPIMNEESQKTLKFIEASESKAFETKTLFMKYSVNVISKCTFGVDPRCLDEENPEIWGIAAKFFEFSYATSIRQTLIMCARRLAETLGLQFLDKKATNRLAEIIGEVYDSREKSSVKGTDLIDMMISVKKNKEFESYYDKPTLLAQPLNLFAAGFETTSGAISFTLYEYAMNPDIQTRARKEIEQAMLANEGRLDYSTVMSAKYMDMCISEVLRKYPVLGLIDRICNVRYKVPGHDIVIEKGTSVLIPIIGFHYDEQYFPNPEKYDPERFLERGGVNENGYYYLPFGKGPRICIGARFGLLGTKVALAQILLNYEVEKTPETPAVIEFYTKSFLLASKDGIPLRFKPLNSK